MSLDLDHVDRIRANRDVTASVIEAAPPTVRCPRQTTNNKTAITNATIITWIKKALIESGQLRFRSKSWPQESEQRDKWSFCLTAGKIDPRIRRDDEQTSTPEPHTGFQGEGGASRHQGRDDAVRTGTAV